MKNKILYSIVAVLISAITFTACSDNDDTAVAKACLVSASSLTFSPQNADDKLVTVYSDGAWRVEAPDWVTVTPSSGVGTTDVTISVTDNLRDGAIDNPRKAEVQFRGDLIMSIATLMVIQEGDKYRDVKSYSVSEISSLTDETVLTFNGVVSSVTASGFYVSDSNYGIFFSSSTAVSVGDEVYVEGEKATDKYKFAYVSCDNVSIQDNNQAAILPEATDISSNLDSYKSSNNTYVKVTGSLDGSIITVDGATLTVMLDDTNSALGLSSYNGHNATVEGWFGGVVTPVVRLVPVNITDLGINEVIYWADDFEWLDPWSVASSAGRTVESDNLSATAPALTTPKVDGVTALNALEAQGYEFLRVTTKTSGECIYLQQNYLKFGKTSYQAGIILPSIDNIPDGVNVKLSFDWCTMRQGTGTMDPTEIVVIVANGADEVVFGPFEHGMASGTTLSWINQTVDLTGIKVDANTKITIRNSDDQWPSAKALRWFLDNVKIAQIK